MELFHDVFNAEIIIYVNKWSVYRGLLCWGDWSGIFTAYLLWKVRKVSHWQTYVDDCHKFLEPGSDCTPVTFYLNTGDITQAKSASSTSWFFPVSRRAQSGFWNKGKQGALTNYAQEVLSKPKLKVCYSLDFFMKFFKDWGNGAGDLLLIITILF